MSRSFFFWFSLDFLDINRAMLNRFIKQTIVSAFYSTTKSDEDKSKEQSLHIKSG